eukprot:CAMPEP_0206454836 /NCGR_PEP_ID=MMETSP0324_2-20121206/21382_1 /ASSEMBLY_ACC=CAM_ASM_000836 /TAXON_ID=2866 /ORGANISM="Crypthecodinium cohnii, Strain Seligo" /LENGTH=329 /DNA_ID=CAMNT_0053925401 /DNA_START=70 /DNA_END=1059 /DNA_ORIENTATION=-
MATTVAEIELHTIEHENEARSMKLVEDSKRDTDSNSDSEDTTPTTISEADTSESLADVEASEMQEDSEDAGEVPQLGPGLYHDDVPNVTPAQPSEALIHEEVDQEITKEKVEDEASKPALPSRNFTKSETLFVFDWDDTLIPSSWLSGHNLRLDDRTAVEPWHRELLGEAARVVSKTLAQAKRHGTVVLVTNAERGWIELSCQKFMPSVLPLLEGVRMVSARTSYESSEAPSPLDWKLCAFSAEVERFCGPSLYDQSNAKNIFSLGDGTHEREALLHTCSGLPGCRSKSLKFAERPDIHQIIKQHELVQGCFENMLHYDGNLDLCTQCA